MLFRQKKGQITLPELTLPYHVSADDRPAALIC